MIKSSSLGMKLILLIIFLGALSLTHTAILYRSIIKSAEREHSENVFTLVDYLRVPVEDFVVTGNKTNLKRILLPTIESKRISGIAIESPSGERIFSFPEKLDYSLPTREVELTEIDPDLNLGLIPGIEDANYSPNIGRMIIFLNNTKARETVSRLWFELLVISMIFIVIVVTVISMLRRYFINPLNQVFKDAEHIIDGDYDLVRQLNRTDELGILSKNQKRIADAISQHDQIQKARLQDILRSNADAMAIHKEKSLVVDRLLGGLTPALQEAIHTVQFLQDKPSVQAMLSKSILYALSLAEESSTFVMEDSKRFSFSPEEIPFIEFTELIKEYMTFFARRHTAQIEVKLDYAEALKEKVIIADKKELLRFVSYIVEMVDERRSTPKTTLKAIVALDGTAEGHVTCDAIIRDSESSYDEPICNAINAIMLGDNSERHERYLKSALQTGGNLTITPFTLIGLKNLNDVTGSSYSIIKSPERKVMHAFSIPLFCISHGGNVTGGARSSHSNSSLLGLPQTIVLIGPIPFLRSMMQKFYSERSKLKFETYDSAVALFPQAETHYVIDLVSDKHQGMLIGRRLVCAKDERSNVAAVIPSANADSGFASWCDIDFDMCVYDSLSQEDLKSVALHSSRSSRETVVKSIMDSIQNSEKG